MATVIESYLVSLGFRVDHQAVSTFQSTLEMAQRSVAEHVGGITATVLKAQASVVGSFVAISAAILGVVENAAKADQQYRLLGLRMLMSTEGARKLDMVTKALGVDLATIYFDPESRARATAFIEDIDKMQVGLGPNFARNMFGIRSVSMEFGRLQMALKFLQQGFASSLFEKLFPPGSNGLAKIHQMITDFETALPDIAKKLSTLAIPILRSTWKMLMSIGEAAKAGANAFTNIVGLFSGDSSIVGAEFKFENLATAITHCVDGLTALIKTFTDAENVTAHGAAGLAALLAGNPEVAAKEFSLAIHGTPEVRNEKGEVIRQGEGGLSLASGIIVALGGLTGVAALAGIARMIGNLGIGKYTLARGVSAVANGISELLGFGGAAETATGALGVESAAAAAGVATAAEAAGATAATGIATAGSGIMATIAGIVPPIAALVAGLGGIDLWLETLRPESQTHPNRATKAPTFSNAIGGGGSLNGLALAFSAWAGENIAPLFFGDGGQSTRKPSQLGDTAAQGAVSGSLVDRIAMTADTVTVNAMTATVTASSWFRQILSQYRGNTPSQLGGTAARVAKELGIDANVPLNQIPSAAGGMVVPSGFNAILGSLQPREWVLPANIAAGAFSNRDAVREYHSRTPQVVSHVSYRTVSLGGVNLGGIHITQPGADIRTIRGEMVQLIREELHEQIMQDILQMQPIW